jgi:hypothetical protein
LLRLCGSVLAVAVFGFAATVLYLQTAQLPTATPLDAQDDPLQNTGMFVKRDRPVGTQRMDGRRQQDEPSDVRNWQYTDRPLPSGYRIF